MSGCNATLTLADVTDCDRRDGCSGINNLSLPRPWLCTGATKIVLHTIECDKPDHPERDGHVNCGPGKWDEHHSNGVIWSDDTRGAKPHTPDPYEPTDAEFTAAWEAMWPDSSPAVAVQVARNLRAALRASAKARREDGR